MNNVLQAIFQIFKGVFNLALAVASLLSMVVGRIGYGIYRLLGGKPRQAANTLPPSRESKSKVKISFPLFGRHRCPHCHNTLDGKANDDLCPHCYGDLTRICPGCSETISVKKRTCPHCKTHLPKKL